jgi:hypothetical protein
METEMKTDTTAPQRRGDREEELNPTDRMGRQERIPIGRHNPLKFDERPGFRRRVVNDVTDGERMRMFEDAGWKAVNVQTGGGDARAGADTQIGATVNRSVGGGIRGILMEIPERYYNEDQAAKQREIDEHEKQMIRNRPPGLTGEIKIER